MRRTIPMPSQVLNSSLWFATAVIMLVSCANATDVRVTADPEIIRGCAFVAMINAYDSADLQRKASRLGGNVALVQIQWDPSGPVQGLKSGVYSYADVTVFRCEGTQPD